MNEKLNLKMLDVVRLGTQSSRGTLVEQINTAPSSFLVEVTDEDGVPTELLVSDAHGLETEWRMPERPAGQEGHPTAQDWFEQGLLLLQNGLVSQARSVFADSFRADARTASALMNNLAKDTGTRGDFEAAIFLLTLILEFEPNYGLGRENLALTYLNRGVALARRGEIEKALQDFNSTLLWTSQESTVKLCTRNLVAAYTWLAVRHSTIKQHHEALHFFFLAFQLWPSGEIARKNLALALVSIRAAERGGRELPSEDRFRQFTLLGLTLSECLNAYGATAAGLGYLQVAKAALRRALTVDPTNTLAERNLEIVSRSPEAAAELPLGIRPFEPQSAPWSTS